MINSMPDWLLRSLQKINEDSLHHAFLVTGKKGIGKELFINHLGSLLLCNANGLRACKDCFSCNLESFNNHPDCYELTVEEGKKLIGIDQIHQLREKLYESAFLGKNKIVLINKIEKISREGLDSVLKILEEPPKNTYFLFTTDFINQIPGTIRSRCFDLELTLPSEEELISWLKDYSQEEVITASNLSENSPFQTKAFLDNNLMEVRNEFIKEISGIIKNGKEISSISEKWVKQRDSLIIKIEWMIRILHDSVKFHSDPSINAISPDTDNISRYLSENTDVESIHFLISNTNKIWNAFSLDSNLREDYQLNSLFIDWEKFLGISKKV